MKCTGTRGVTFGLLILLAVAGRPQPSVAQTRQLNEVMRQKLDYSKDALEAIVTSDWAQLDRASRALTRATEDPAWRILRAPEYLRQSDAFLQATEDLRVAAERRDLDAASLAYVSLTTSCVSCHRHVTRARLAR